MADDDVKLVRLFKIRRTVLQMLRDRGYEVDITDLDMDFDSFGLSYGNAVSEPGCMNYTYRHNDPSVASIRVKFDLPDGRIGNTTIQTLTAELQHERATRCIAVMGEGQTLTPTVRKHIDTLRAELQMHFEFFTPLELLINITEHKLVPRHRPLRLQEKDELLKRYGISETQLPRILRSDPVVRYLGVDAGTILEITRKSETSGRYVTYRLVC
jgi:DNA-directed RNA polymerase I, II, and III subunit RPABC1